MSTNDKFPRTLLDLFGRCAEQRKPLVIEINKDLLPLYPVAVDLIFSLLSERIPSIFTSLTKDKREILFRNSVTISSSSSLVESSQIDRLRVCLVGIVCG